MKTGEIVHQELEKRKKGASEELKTGEVVHENRRAGTSERLEKMKKIPRSIEILIYKFAQIIQLLLGSDLYAIILYGSYARGDYNNSSDIDIMILVDLPETEIKKIENDIDDVVFEMEINI